MNTKEVRKNSEKCHLKWLFNIIFVDLVENLAGTQGKLPGKRSYEVINIYRALLQFTGLYAPMCRFVADRWRRCGNYYRRRWFFR